MIIDQHKIDGYQRIFATFGSEVTEATVSLFDGASGKGCGEYQALINCMAILLETIEAFDDDGTETTVPLLCKMRALQAVYHLGLEHGKATK